MGDAKMPGPSEEWLFSARNKPYPKILAIHVRGFSARLRHAGTMHELEVIKRDILRSDLVSSAQAIQELRGIGNARATELKYKSPGGKAWWT
ncbi:MAG: hypothetical protein AAB798_02380 [Patescibacteria group bacterium]